MSAQRACPWAKGAGEPSGPGSRSGQTEDTRQGDRARGSRGGARPGQEGPGFQPRRQSRGPSPPQARRRQPGRPAGRGHRAGWSAPCPGSGPWTTAAPTPGLGQDDMRGTRQGREFCCRRPGPAGETWAPAGSSVLQAGQGQRPCLGTSGGPGTGGPRGLEPRPRGREGTPLPPALTLPQAPERDREAQREEGWATHETWCPGRRLSPAPRGRGAQRGGVRGAGLGARGQSLKPAQPLGAADPTHPKKGAVHSRGVWCPAGCTGVDGALVGRCGGGAEGRGDLSCGLLTPEAASSHRRAQATPAGHSRGRTFPSVGPGQGARPAGGRGSPRWTNAFPRPHREAGYCGTRRCGASCPPAHQPSGGPLPAPGARPLAW